MNFRFIVLTTFCFCFAVKKQQQCAHIAKMKTLHFLITEGDSAALLHCGDDTAHSVGSENVCSQCRSNSLLGKRAGEKLLCFRVCRLITNY